MCSGRVALPELGSTDTVQIKRKLFYIAPILTPLNIMTSEQVNKHVYLCSSLMFYHNNLYLIAEKYFRGSEQRAFMYSRNYITFK